jgi:hypothetical protein
MIPKRGHRFSEKIKLEQKFETMRRPARGGDNTTVRKP